MDRKATLQSGRAASELVAPIFTEQAVSPFLLASTINFLLNSAGDPSKSIIAEENNDFDEPNYEFNLGTKESSKKPNVHFDYKIHDFDELVFSEDWSEDPTYFKIRDFTTFQMGHLENAGILTDRLIEVSSTRLKRAAYPGKYALCNCNLQRKNLVSIELLQYHPYLQYLDLSRNKLSTLKPLEYLPFLKYLDASHNALTILLDFKAPLNLTYVDCSHNTIETLPDLTDFWSIVYLDVSYNMIEEMEGLENLMYLNFLNLSYNNISCVSSLPKRNLQILYLDHNIISDYTDDIINLYSLYVVSIGHNKLTSLSVFRKMSQLRKLFVFHNEIQDLYELVNIRHLPILNTLDIRDNPVCEKKKFREICLFLTPSLRLLDGEVLEAEEKGMFDYLYKNDSQIHASYLECMMEILRTLNVQDVDSDIYACYLNKILTLLIVGPTGSGKKNLVRSLLKKYPFFKQGVSHTTRRKCTGEVDGKDYYFVSNEEFKQLQNNGKFLCVSIKYGSTFGISIHSTINLEDTVYNSFTNKGYDELRKITDEQQILLIHCDIISALQIKSKFVKSIMILAMPRDINLHKEWLREKFYCSHWISTELSAYLVKYNTVPQYTCHNDMPCNAYIQEILNEMLRFLDDDVNGGEEMSEYKSEEAPENIVKDIPENVPDNVQQEEKCVLMNIDSDYSEYNPGYVLSILKQPDNIKPCSSRSGECSASSNDDQAESKKLQEKKISFLARTIAYSLVSETASASDSVSITKSTDDGNGERSFLQDLTDQKTEFFDYYNRHSSVEENVILFDYFLTEQTRSRKKYLDIYLNFPGMFVSMVDTVDLNDTMKQLDELVTMWLTFQKENDSKLDDCVLSSNCPEMVKEKMDMIFNMF